MEPTQVLNFNIPKLKRQVTKDNLFEIDSNSRDAKELLDNVARSYLDQKYNGPWKVKSVNMVRNTELEQEYKAKRTEMKEEGRHSRELVDQIAFFAIKEPSFITKIAKNGMMTKNLPFSIIGEHKSGVYLTKHADVQLKMVETISSQTITALFVFNAMLGKCKAINERVMSSTEPTPNYDCHVPLQPAQPSDPHIVQLQRSQVYLYEYDNDGMPANRPRQCLPYAVITYEKIENFTVGPLKSIYCYDPTKSSSQTKKSEDKPDWKKTPRNMGNPQLPFPKNTPLDNQIRPPLPFGSMGWGSNLMPGGQASNNLGPMTQPIYNPDAPHDLEPGPNQCGMLNSNMHFNYSQQVAVTDGQGVVVHRSGSDPRRRFQQKSIDEPIIGSEQQRNLPPQLTQSFPNVRGGYQYSNDDQNMDNMSGWEPKAPHGFYSECEPSENSNQPWYQSAFYNSNKNSNNTNTNNNNINNNKCSSSGWADLGSSSVEADEQNKQKSGSTNCDTKSTSNKSSTSVKRPIPFALKKKTTTSTDAATSQQKTQEDNDQDKKTKNSSSAELDKTKSLNSTATNQKKDSTSTESDLKPKPQGKVQETVSNKIPFPKKTSAPPVSEEVPKSQTGPQDSHMQDLLNKLLQAECKDNNGTPSSGGKPSGKGKNAKTKAKGSTAGKLSDKPLSVQDIPESDLKKLQDYMKEKIKSTKENEKKAPKRPVSDNTPKIKTVSTSSNQGLKTTILLPIAGKNNEENGPKLEDLTKLLGTVESVLNRKNQPETTSPKWEDNYLSFLKSVQQKKLIPNQHHKWVRKKEVLPEPPPPEKIPPPANEVSIDDVVNTKLMKELLLEQDFSESTSVSEADSLYLPPTERKKRKTNSLTTRRQAKKKAPFDMTSYRRRRKRQKLQRKAAAEFDNSSLASTTSSFGFGDNSYSFWDADFKEFEAETSLNDDLLSYGKERPFRESTLKDLGFDSWKDAMLSLKFQPVVILKDCVQQITSHLHQEGGSNMMEWIGSQKELLETLNLPPGHSPIGLSSGSSSKTTNQSKANTKAAVASKSNQKSKFNKISSADYQSTTETISIKSIKASVRSEINKIKKMSKKSPVSGISKKKISKPKAPAIEIPRIKAKLPEKAFTQSTKSDTSLQLFSSISKDVKKPSSALTASNLLSSTLQSKTMLSNANKTIPPKGIIKNSRTDSSAPKSSTVSPATFPPTDQSLKVDLLMESISAPPTTTTVTSEAEQKKLNEQKKAAEQKKQKISFQAYMEKHVKPKPVKSPPREKTNVFEAFTNFLSSESNCSIKPISEPLVTPPAPAPLLEKLKPSLVMPPGASTFTNSLFSPLSPPPPPPQIPRDPRIPSKLTPPLPNILPTLSKPAKEDLKSILKDKPSKPSSMSHRKAPPPKTIPTSITIPLEDPREASLTLVDPRLSRKPPPSQPDFHPVKEPLPKPPPLNDSLLPRDPRLLKMYGEYQPDGVLGSKPNKVSTLDTPADIYSPVKLKSDLTEGVSDISRKSKPLVKKDMWNLCAIQTVDDKPKPPRRLSSTNEESALSKSSPGRQKPGSHSEDIPVYAQFSKDVAKGLKPAKISLDSKNEATVNSEPQEGTIDRQAWGFYREMSPKKSGSEDANSVLDKDFKPSLIQQKSDDNTCSDMDIASESPQVLYFSDSDSNMIGEDLTKPLYIDESASTTPRRDSFESYKFSLKSPEHSFKKISGSDFAMDPRKSTSIDLNEKNEGFRMVSSECTSSEKRGTNVFGVSFNNVSSEKTEPKLSPFNETVPPAEPESKDGSDSSLFCAYQMEGKAEIKDTSHIWMKSLSSLSQAKAVSSLNVPNEIFDVLRKVVKENIPAGQKELLQCPSLLTPNFTRESGKKTDILDMDLFKLSNLNKELFNAEDLKRELFNSESADDNISQSESSDKVDASWWKTSSDENASKKATPQSQQENLCLNKAKTESNKSKLSNEMYSPTHPTSDEMSEKNLADSTADSKIKEFVPGQAIPVLNFSGKKQGSFHKPPKKSRSLSPTTTTPSPTHYVPSTSGWMAPQQQFWSGLNQKFDRGWQNVPSFNPIMTTSHPTQPIWPHPVNVTPNPISFPLGYVTPDLPSYHSNQTDSSKPSNLFDWFADKINPKGDNSNSENNSPKTSKDSHVELVSNFLNMLSSSSKPGNNSGTNSPPTSLASTKGTSSKSATGSSSAETKTSKTNPKNAKIPKSESFTELASINTNPENSNSKADSEKSRSSSYSPTDKTSEIVSISASDPSMSPRSLDSVKTAEKEAFFKLKRTVSIDSSLSSESCSRFSKMDFPKKNEEKLSKSDLPTLSAASPSSDDDSGDNVWHIMSNEEKKSDTNKSDVEQNTNISEPSTSTLVSDSAGGQQDIDTLSENNNSTTNEELKKKRNESGEEWKKSKTRTKKGHKRGKKKLGHSSSIPKSIQISTINSKSLKDIKLAECNRQLLRKLAEQYSKKKRKSELQNLLESVKKIKKELASQPPDEKGSSLEKSERKSFQSQSRSRHASEEKNSSSRTKKSAEKDEKNLLDKLWKPVKSVEDDFSAAASSSSSTSNNKTSKSSNNTKQNSNKQDTEACSTKSSESSKQEGAKETKEKDSKPSKENKDCDSELEEGELPDEDSESSEEEENVTEEYSKRRSSRRKSENVRRKRRQPDRRHSSHDERFYKRRVRQSKQDEGMPSKSEHYSHERMDTYSRGPPDEYLHDRLESYQHNKMDCYPMDTPEGYPPNRMDYPNEGSEDCSSDRPQFYPPNRMDNYNNGRPDNFARGKPKRFHGKRGRFFRGKFAPHPHNKGGGHFRDESNNYPDNNFNDHGPGDDRYPRGRMDSYPYGKPDCYMHENYRPSLDPDDYIQDKSDGYLYEKSDDYIPFKDYSHNWPDRHHRGRRGGSYSPGHEVEFPKDGHFLGRGSPSREEGPMHPGRYHSDNWPDKEHLREIKIEVKNNCVGDKSKKGFGHSVSNENLAAESLPEMEKKQEKEETMSGGQTSYGESHKQTGPNQTFANPVEEEEKKMRDSFDTVDSYLQMFVKEGCTQYKILKKALGVPLEARFNNMSKTKRKKIRKKIQSQLQALKQAPSISNSAEVPPEPDSTFIQAPEKSSSFKMEDFQNFSSFDGNPNSMEYLKNWLNQRPDEDQFFHSRSSSETRDDSEDDGNLPGSAVDNIEDMPITDPEIKRAIKTVSWMEKSPGFGTPHQRVPLNLLLAEEKDNLFSSEGCFLILMRKIPRKAVERLVTLREVLNFLTCELQVAQKANDILKYHKLQATKNKLHDRRKDVLEKFTGTINPNRLQTIKESKKIYEDCLEYMKRNPEPLPVDKEFVVKTIKAIQGHINMTKKFLDEKASSNTAPPMSSIGFCPDMAGPNSAPDHQWPWFVPRNMDKPISGYYNQPWNNAPF